MNILYSIVQKLSFLFPFLPRKIKLIFHVFPLLQSLYAQQLNPTSRVNNVPRSSRLENRNTVTIFFSQRISSSRAPTVTSLSKQWYFSARAAPPPSEHFISFGSARHASLSRLRGENGATLPRQRGGASLRAVSREIYGERGKFIDSISAIFNRARRVRARLEFANERTPPFFFLSPLPSPCPVNRLGRRNERNSLQNSCQQIFLILSSNLGQLFAVHDQ